MHGDRRPALNGLTARRNIANTADVANDKFSLRRCRDRATDLRRISDVRRPACGTYCWARHSWARHSWARHSRARPGGTRHRGTACWDHRRQRAGCAMRIRAPADDRETRCEQAGHHTRPPRVHASKMRSQASRFHRVASQAATCADTLQLRQSSVRNHACTSEGLPSLGGPNLGSVPAGALPVRPCVAGRTVPDADVAQAPLDLGGRVGPPVSACAGHPRCR